MDPLLFLSAAAESFWLDFASWWEKPEHPNSSRGVLGKFGSVLRGMRGLSGIFEVLFAKD